MRRYLQYVGEIKHGGEADGKVEQKNESVFSFWFLTSKKNRCFECLSDHRQEPQIHLVNNICYQTQF